LNDDNVHDDVTSGMRVFRVLAAAVGNAQSQVVLVIVIFCHMCWCCTLQNKAQVIPNQGVWDMRGKQLYQGIQIRMWAIACFAAQRSVGEESLRW